MYFLLEGMYVQVVIIDIWSQMSKKIYMNRQIKLHELTCEITWAILWILMKSQVPTCDYAWADMLIHMKKM